MPCYKSVYRPGYRSGYRPGYRPGYTPGYSPAYRVVYFQSVSRFFKLLVEMCQLCNEHRDFGYRFFKFILRFPKKYFTRHCLKYIVKKSLVSIQKT